MMDLSSIEAADREVVAAITKQAEVDLDDCYQCGKCSAGCPMAHEMDLVPRRVIRLLQLGFGRKALTLRTPWVCAQCNVCSTRCPQNVDIAGLMLAVRLQARAHGSVPFKESELFDDIFINNIRKYGKSNEAILAMMYNLKSGHLMQDVFNAPKMAARGMIGPKIHKIRDRDAVRQMVDRILKDEEVQR